MTTLFISDLHLDLDRPETTEVLLALLAGEARQAEALYILGDLFEAWVGDDDPSEVGAQVADALRTVNDAGVPIHFIRGNRDFLIGRDYAARCAMRLLPDPCVIDLYGQPTLLLHGDLLCTDDLAYQQWRRQSRDPDWQAAMLAQPLAARLALAGQARAQSKAHQANAAEAIMDAAPDAIDAMFRLYGVNRMIHGHTHRPAIHCTTVDGRPCTRIVLGDWYQQGSVLRVDEDGFALAELPLG
ncbi:MAG: UDP-2,3-diacylglucosamine diphosphatase [Gammaproteobacteria bacterium HGW-Gammaproteobacteria-7]|nr:MAG: UDP-2,3-diacylglucosamine diphosphatase [Gammaproteobacteria bacterium HGW-Gammaproteobacteria-7]